MPPKKKQQESAKTKASKREKAADDKTFGLKNKNRSTKVQSYVKQVEQQTKVGGSAEAKKRQAEAEQKAREKKEAERAKLESEALLKPVVQQQKVPFGVDPKSVVCNFFKQGSCQKGKNCKFSHDLEVERKAEKKDLYSDERKNEDSMEDWDEEKLRSVVLSKHGNFKTTTDKVCKYFIEAVENKKYGWFWVCPNGGDNCKYKHSLPPGFTLKTKEQQRLERDAAANEPSISLEEFVETERRKLPKDLTPVTYETFMKWKKDRQDKKAAEQEMEQKKQKTNKVLSGKELMESGKFDDEEDDGIDDSFNLSELRRRTEEVEEESEE